MNTEVNLNEPHRVRSIEPGSHRHANKDECRVMLEKYVEEGKARAEKVVERIFSQIPEDRVVRARAINFIEDTHQRGDDAVSMVLGTNPIDGRMYGVHDNALQQLAGWAEIPINYVRDLQETDWGRALLARNLNELFQNRFTDAQRFLVRSMEGEARGFLSTKYRRLDSRPIVDGMIGELSRLGAVICDGIATDVRVSIRAIMPDLVEALPGEWSVFGLNFHNSDYGRGALEMSSYLLRVWCTNAATMEDALRKIHLGARLDDNLEFSQKTYELDTATMSSAVRDITGHLLSDARTGAIASSLRKAAQTEVEPKALLARFRSQLSKGEADAIAEAFNGPDVELLPAGNTAYRFSNAISFVGGRLQDADRRLDLEALAGKVLVEAA